MKPATRVMEVTSTLEGEKIGMSIDEGALAHIMAILTDLYSDPELAIIREYSTNALDAHIEAGINRPIEVTTPTNLAPFFRVKDYGPGLNIEDIRNIYSRYGTSSKRESDSVVGMLGLGCKSALTYTDQFTLVGRKEGIATQVSVSRNDDGGGSMTIVDTYRTDEENGVEVIVPTKTHNSLEQKARNFFKYWQPGTILLNGIKPEPFVGQKITDNIYLSDYGSNINHGLVVMGNVSYPVPASIFPSFDLGYFNGCYYNKNLVAFVKIGDVHFTPSREALQMTAKTKDTLTKTVELFHKEHEKALIKEINSVSTKVEAIKVALEARKTRPTLPLVYRGEDIPLEIRYDSTTTDQFLHIDPSGWGKSWNKGKVLSVNQYSTTLWITGYDSDTFTPYKKKKLKRWAALNSINSRSITCVKELPIPEWIDPALVYKWEDINATKMDVSIRKANGRLSGSYEAYVNGIYVKELQAIDIDTSKPIYWVDRHRLRTYKYLDTHTVVYLPANRLAKFKRDFPMAQDISDALHKMATEFLNDLTEVDKLIIGSDNFPSIPSLLPPEKIKDPKLAQLITAAKTKNDLKDKAKFFASYKDFDFTPLVNDILEPYLLLSQLSLYGKLTEEFKEHVLIYLNTIYKERKK